jgi:putative ATPase
MPISQPLADKIRPSGLDEFIGQEHLRGRIQALMGQQRTPSLLFFGPPGCGKSTLALIFAENSGEPYVRVSAPEAGLAVLRKKLSGVRVLVLDELHRFSKAQQDFFLPLLESGELALLATTTENPSFSVTNQLLSRMTLLKLTALSKAEMEEIARRGSQARGLDLGGREIDFLSTLSGGDARTLLNLLEYVADLPEDARSVESLKKLAPETILRGDRTGDTHYELASAMIKSIRGSDPDAAVYYLACLLEGGEDPRFIARRLILSASEDVGLADPRALQLAVACRQAVEFTGMPEGFIPLAETCVYLAVAPKSNASYSAYLAAAKEIREHGKQPVPLHLRNPSTRLHKKWGYGKGYKYPHNYPGAWVEQDYLPEALIGRVFYKPKDQGAEPGLLAWWKSLKKGK